MNYTYKAVVKKIYDGDTITVDIDLGLNVWKKNEKIRLANIDAPEVRGEKREAGLKSRDFLRYMILNKEINITTFKDKKGKYGRYIGIVILPDGDNVRETNINELMVSKGYAIKKLY